jgi:thiamine biosynthesis lipoprotein
MHTHLEPVMGTVVGFASPDPLPADGLAEAVGLLYEANRIFSTWDADSPMSRLRSGQTTMHELDCADAALVAEVLERCQLARHLTGGAFDPWAMPGGVDPTGLVKGWAAGRALHALSAGGAGNVMVNAGGDIAVAGHADDGPWRVGIRHPAQPDAYSAIIEVSAAVATSGDYERPGQLIDPITRHTARVAASATVTGPDLDLADALATGLAVRGLPVLAAIDRLPGYHAYLITDDGHHFATPGMAFTTSAHETRAEY